MPEGLLSGSADADFPPEKLWNFNRLKPELGLGSWVFLTLWTPIGVPLCATRVLLLILGATFYPLAHGLGIGAGYARCVLPLLSYWVTVRGRENLSDHGTPVVVSNHVSDFDACAIWAVEPPAGWTLVMNDHWRKVVGWVKAVGWPVSAIFTSAGNTKDEVRAALPAEGEKVQQRLLFFPEGATCSGVSVMQFNWFIFGVERPVLPFAIKLTNPWPVQMQMNGCSVMHNILALFFLPMVFYEITVLPQVASSDLGKEKFAQEVREQIIQYLRVPGTIRALKDKKQYAKDRKALLAAEKQQTR